MSTVHRDLRFLHKSQALTLCDRYGLAPALKPGEASFGVAVVEAVAGGMMRPNYYFLFLWLAQTGDHKR